MKRSFTKVIESVDKGTLVRGFSVLVVLVLLCTLFQYYGLGDAATEAWMDQHVREAGWRGVMVYVALVTLFTAVGIPRQVCSFLGGYVFGMWYGTLWATIGTALACTLCFSYARFLGQSFIQRRFGKKITTFQRFLGQSPFVLTVAVRIVPLGSNFLTNFLAGVSTIPALSFLGGSYCGFVLQNLIFAMLGSGMHVSTAWQTGLSAVLYVLSLSLGYWIYRRYKASC